MSDIDKALLEILSAAQQFLDEGEYEKVVIQANRLLTISAVWARIPMAANIAVSLRLAGQDLGLASAVDGKLDISQKQEFERLLAGLRSLLESTSDDYSGPWIQLTKFKRAFWAKTRGSLEGRSYTSNEAVVNAVLKWARETLSESSALMSGPRGSPFAGVANEVDWTVRAFDANARQIASYAVVSALSWESEYERWKRSKDERDSVRPNANSEFQSLVSTSLALIYPAEGKWSEIGSLLTDIARLWRTDFSTFFDLFMLQQQRQYRELTRAEPDESRTDRKGFRKSKLASDR